MTSPPHRPAVRAALAQSDFFRELAGDSLDALVAIAAPRRLDRRDTLFREGDPGVAVYLLAAGSVQLTKAGPDNRVAVVKTVRPGELFAEVILFETGRYPVTATAIADSRLVALDRRELLRLLRRDDFRDDFLAMLMGKLRYLSDRVRDLSVGDLETRLLRFLREQYGDADRITCPLSKKDVAAAIGATPEALSRLLRRLRDTNRLYWTGHAIILPRAPPEQGTRGPAAKTRNG